MHLFGPTMNYSRKPTNIFASFPRLVFTQIYFTMLSQWSNWHKEQKTWIVSFGAVLAHISLMNIVKDFRKLRKILHVLPMQS